MDVSFLAFLQFINQGEEREEMVVWIFRAAHLSYHLGSLNFCVSSQPYFGVTTIDEAFILYTSSRFRISSMDLFSFSAAFHTWEFYFQMYHQCSDFRCSPLRVEVYLFFFFLNKIGIFFIGNCTCPSGVWLLGCLWKRCKISRSR